MSMALFDLDNTLLGGDSDYLWGEFLVSIGAVDKQAHQRENARYFAQYQAGVLDVHEFRSFQLEPLADNQVESLLAWRERFVRDWIAPLVLAKGRELVASPQFPGLRPGVHLLQNPKLRQKLYGTINRF